MADSSSRSLLAPPADYSRPRSAWTGTRTIYKLPWLIFSFLVLLIACTAAVVTILLKSHEDPVKSWRIQPSVLLSILAGVYTIGLGGLFTAGVAVVWWRSFAHGTTLKRLHFIDAGASPKDFFRAFLAGSHARRVAVAALVVFLVKLGIGPVLQRSTRASARDVVKNIDTDIYIAKEIPDGFFGTWGVPNSNTALLTSQTALGISQATFFNFSIPTKSDARPQCPENGTCEAAIIATGLNFYCYSETETIDLLDSKSLNATLFSIDMEMHYETGVPELFVATKHVSSIQNCIGTLATNKCHMVPATVQYPAAIVENFIQPNILAVVDNPASAIVSNYTSKGDTPGHLGDPLGTLVGISASLRPSLLSEAYLSRNQDGYAVYSIRTKNESTSPWANMLVDAQFTSDQQCRLVWNSPKEFVLKYILGFLFRSSYDLAGTEDNYKQTMDAVYRGKELRYITDFRWLAASVAVMVVGTAAALSLLWGWWQLHRYVTLSPLETGKALGAPILLTAGPEQEANSIVEEVGHERVAHDGDELVWNGSIYATGVGGSPRNQSRREATEHDLGDITGGSSGSSSLRGRGHRRGFSNVSDESPTQRRPSFEHGLGYTTRRPYDDEEEMDIGQYGRPRARSGGNDMAPLLTPMTLTMKAMGSSSPKLPPIPRTGTLKMEPLSPGGRPRRASNGKGMGKRPLSKIEERNSPTLE